MTLPNWHPDYEPTMTERRARLELHEIAGEHWDVNVPNGGSGPVVAPNGDPGAEGLRCRICGREEWFRGPGY